VYASTIKIVGIGTTGGKAVAYMMGRGIAGADYIYIDTDAATLSSSPIPRKLLIKGKVSSGFNPSRSAYTKAIRLLDGSEMIFIVGGLWSIAGKWIAHSIASIAKELGAFTIGVIKKPACIEGKRGKRLAREELTEIRGNMDTLIIIPMKEFSSHAKKIGSEKETHETSVDNFWRTAKAITELVTVDGVVSLDIASMRTVMGVNGLGNVGFGVGKGKSRAVEAASNALKSLLTEKSSIKGAKGILLNITGGEDLALQEIDACSSLISTSTDSDTEIMYGAVIDESMQFLDQVNVTLIAVWDYHT